MIGLAGLFLGVILIDYEEGPMYVHPCGVDYDATSFLCYLTHRCHQISYIVMFGPMTRWSKLYVLWVAMGSCLYNSSV
jgi:hypothetical protein